MSDSIFSWGTCIETRVLLTVTVAIAAMAAGAGDAAGQNAPDGAPPSVDVRDLPPLPRVAGDRDGVDDIVARAREVDELVVTGAAKREQTLGTVASAVTVVTAEQIRRYGYRTLAEALRGVAGMYIVDDRMVERVGIRGVQPLGDGNTRILVLVDGSTLNEPWSQMVDAGHALPVHLDDVARIEVIRGPVSSIYGTNAFLGIVNVVTLAADKAPRAYGRVGAGTFGTTTGNAGFSSGGLNEQLRGFASWSRRSGDSFRYPDFQTDGSPAVTDADGMQALAGGLSATYGGLFLQTRAAHRARELPGAPYDSLPGGENRNTDTYALLELGYAHELEDLATLSARVYGNLYHHDSELMLEREGSASGMQPFSATATSRWLGAELRGLFFLLPDERLDLTAGIVGELSDVDSESMLVNDPANAMAQDSGFDSTGVYAELSSVPLPWLSVTAGLRYDRNSLFDNSLSPRGALLLRKGKRFGGKLLYAEGFRNPSLFETFYDDGERYRPSGVELRPESIRSLEAVAWARPLPGLDVRLSAWKWDLEDLIEKRSVFDPDSLANRFQYQNLSEVESRGVELESSYRDTRGWLARLSGALADVRRNRGFEEAINAPALVATAAGSTPALWDRVHLSAEITFVGARNTRDEDVDAEPWLGVDLTVYVPSYRGFDFTLGVRNLIGMREQIPAQSDYDRVYHDGTSLRGIDVLLLPGVGRELFARIGYRY